MADSPAVVPLFNLASNAAVDTAGVEREWGRWRSARPDIAHATPAEIALLPAAWARAGVAGVTDCDEARLNGLQRKAAITTAITLARLRDAQAELRRHSIDSVAAGAPVVVLLGAAHPAHRSVGQAQLWVARSDMEAALRVLGAKPTAAVARARAAITGAATLLDFPGVVLRSKLPSLPPIDAVAIVGVRRTVRWADYDLDTLGPTEAVFVCVVQAAARGMVARVRPLRRDRQAESQTARLVTEALDARILAQAEGFDEVRLRRLLTKAGWSWVGRSARVSRQSFPVD